ncbi:MAG: DNA polymerase III subunit alpha [Bacilli bacterium]|nr:DNA polymerase III subunit alpha [Bacilli bacterium]
MYIPLYNVTNYTLLSSLLKIDDLVSYAQNNNINSISITDTNMYGTMEFIKKCNSKNIKPIIGLTLILNDYRLVYLAKNYEGYKCLLKLSTIQNEREVTIDDLKEYNNDVIAILPYDYRNSYKDLSKLFKDLYLGYTTKKEELEASVITKNIVFFRENLYLNKEDEYYLPYLYRIRDSKTITDEISYDTSNKELNISNINELSDNVGLLNTIKIADSCNIEFPKYELLLPLYDCKDPEKYLFELSKKGLSKRLDGSIPQNYKDRLSYELKIISDMGFPNYFLVVYDFIKYAKKNKILVGPGRGSAAGSLVAYSLGITDIDPLKYDLLFERFLNPERKTMPDIDTDFPDNKRDEVIDYVRKKYGDKRVSGIVTFGTLGAKQVIRDTSRVLNIPLHKVDSLCHYIPTFTKDKLHDFYKNNSLFRKEIDSDESLKTMYKIANYIEGYPRHTSSHAAGIIMSKVDLDEIIPLTTGDGMYLSSFTMEYLEDLGLLKMDFLGLKNLTIITNIIEDIKTTYKKEIDFSKIPLDDKEALKIFEEANTCGIFQFESAGMRNFLRKLKPNTFEDIFAAIALFRPGPAVNIDSYIARKHGKERITYPDKSLEPILKNTYGIFIYQEQIMQLARVYAGYSLGEADILRRAMSKKKVDLIKHEEERFIKQSVELGHDEKQAKEIFNLVLNFAGYGFNRSHSVAYSIIAYKMAYLKAHFKEVFFSNLLTNVIGSVEKTNEYLLEVKANQIEIEKPSINKSSDHYIIDNKKIIYPISNIKSIGGVASNTILAEREKGEFIDIFDAFSRLVRAGIGKKTMETLIYADVFREFEFNRATLIFNLDNLFNYGELTKDLDDSLVSKPEIIFQQEFSEKDLLEKEKDIFGLYLSNHPTNMYRKDNKYAININEVPNHFNKQVDTLILVDKIKNINTKKGDKMAFLTGSDETGSMEYTLFPKVLDDYPKIKKGNLLKIRGRVEKRLNKYQIIVERIKDLENEKETK